MSMMPNNFNKICEENNNISNNSKNYQEKNEKEIICDKSELQIPPYSIFNEKISLLPSKFCYLFEKNSQNSNRERLSDMFDTCNNNKINQILKVPHYLLSKLSYITDGKCRKFFLNHDNANPLNVLRTSQNQFSYNTNFIAESMMRLSNDKEVLETYLKDPIGNPNVIWTEIEDKTLIENKDVYLLDKIKSIKGIESVEKRRQFLQNLNISERNFKF
jgi:hypothetical protein